MIFNSIRGRLQLWYGLILIGVLAGFGITAFQLERTRLLHRVDVDLEIKLGGLSKALELNDPKHGVNGDFRPPPPRDQPPFDGPPQGNLEDRGGLPGSFKLPEGLGFESNSNYYYSVIRRDGAIMIRSSNAPPLRLAFPGLYRERELKTPPGEKLMVGRSIAPELADLHKFGWSMAAAGICVWVLGLAVGWRLAGRALRPVEEISNTAVKIARGDLSQRINIADTKNELGRLAGVLNSTFARLESAFAQQAQFTADAAHELRTPVSVILSQTQTILKHERAAPDYRETLEACQRAAQKMRRLLESLLELARLDAGQEPMRRQPFKAGELVRDCIAELSPLAQERGIRIETVLSDLEMTGDPDRLGQVITNLLTNAIHYNKPQGTITVTAQLQNETVLITVADGGQGISAEVLPHLFKRFYRADKARSGGAGQTGLGLAISKAIVEAHGGVIEVASEAGVGTTFTVRLPANA